MVVVTSTELTPKLSPFSQLLPNRFFPTLIKATWKKPQLVLTHKRLQEMVKTFFEIRLNIFFW